MLCLLFSVSVVSEDSISTSIFDFVCWHLLFPLQTPLSLSLHFFPAVTHCHSWKSKEPLLKFHQVCVEETRSVILWFGLGRLVCLSPGLWPSQVLLRFFLPLCEGGWPEGLKFSNFPYPKSKKALVKSSPLLGRPLYGKCSWLISKWLLLPSPWPNSRQFFSDIYQENLSRIRRVNTMIVGDGGVLRLGPQEF